MSRVVCSIERAERGVLPRRIRLISDRSEESWAFPEIMADDRAALQRGLREAADWVAQRLKVQGRPELAAIVLDTDGSLCSWMTTSSTDPDAIDATLRQAGEPTEDDGAHALGSPPQLSLAEDVRVRGGATIQPLFGAPGRAAPSAGAPGGRVRVGVMAVPDSTVRLLLDELDAQGVGVGRIVTIWHAMAESLDRPTGGERGERVVAEGSSTSAQVIVDSYSSRLLWSWSRGGIPLCSGAFRVERRGDSGVALGRREIARLATEWIAWSTQLGASPTRVRFVAPPDAWSDEDGMGERVAAAWPGATADITFDEDPAALVLAKFAQGTDEGDDATRPALETLRARPGRQHRAMYRWGAATIVVAAAAMGVAAWQVQKSAGKVRAQASGARTEWRETAKSLLPAVAEGPAAARSFDGKAIADLRAEIDRRRQSLTPIRAAPEKPVLQELETLAFVLGNPEYEIQKIDVNGSAVVVDVLVPDTAAYEELVASLNGIAGSSIGSWEKSPRSENRNGRQMIRVNLTGLWAQRPTQPRGSA